MKKHKFDFKDGQQNPNKRTVRDLKQERKEFKKSRTTERQRGRFSMQERS